jgi:uncharacterized coiled-coil protein SlyX
LQAPEEPKKSTEQEEKLKKLKDDIARQQEQLNKLTEKVRACLKIQTISTIG